MVTDPGGILILRRIASERLGNAASKRRTSVAEENGIFSRSRYLSGSIVRDAADMKDIKRGCEEW